MSFERFQVNPKPASEVKADRDKLQLEKEIEMLNRILAESAIPAAGVSADATEKIANPNPDKPLHEVYHNPRQWEGPGKLLE